MIEIALTKPQTRLLLKVLREPSAADPSAAALYESLNRLLDEAAPTSPWRKVIQSSPSSAYRGDGAAVNLYLDCGHHTRELNSSDYEIKRRLGRGEVMKRRCRECAGGPPRRANP